jgi:glycosyltransferase involved in cell wall biosynthesis
MTAAYRKVLQIWKDQARYAPFTRRALARLKWLQASIASPLSARLERLAEAYRAALLSDCPEFVERALRAYVEDPQRAGIWREQQIGWRHLAPQGASATVSKGIVLKAPQPDGERGVILLSYEYNWLPVLLAQERDDLLRRYTILCATAWSPPAFTALWAFAHLPESDICFMISNQRDTAWFQRLKTGTRVVPLYMSHWINPADYQPQPRDRRPINILMVANWGTFKRHWALFRALRELPPSLRVVLVGQPENGRTMEHVRREAELFGVGQRVEFRERLGMEAVTELQCASKVALILSKREGSCVAVAEALFADTPVGLVRSAHIGSADFINSRTGVFLDERRLADGLRDFLARSDSFTPRAWAMDNISCHVSTKKLNALLREQAARDGRPWTRDTCVLGWRPNPCYLSRTDAAEFAPVYAELREHHGLTFALNG